jgi:hypothetical protein
MKLNEVVDITNEITEAFDRILNYKSIGKFIEKDTRFFIYEIEDTDPIIKIQIKIKNIDNKFIGELSFFTDEFGFEQLNISSSGKALSIIATIIDLAQKFISQLDIIFFTCKIILDNEKEIKSKSRIYSKLSKQIAQKNNLNYQSFKVKDDYGFVLSKDEELSSQQIIKYYNEWG